MLGIFPTMHFMPTDCFVALDFETADSGRDSACSIALVRCERGQIVERVSRLIRPPRRTFEFTHIHGIAWKHVATQPAFGQVWRDIAHLVDGAEFIAAHNASFDHSVLDACSRAAAFAMPTTPFLCTVKLARGIWNLHPTKLPDVCRHLRIPLRHHEALSDAEACARIVLAARAHRQQGASAA